MKTISIGDIHGRNIWKDILFNTDINYDLWRTLTDSGVPSDDAVLFKGDHFMNFDKIIFIGDYCDSFDLSNVEILHNLKEIIDFKKKLPDKVVLILGNHDVHYIFDHLAYSGFRSEGYFDLNKLLKENIDLFQMSFLYNNFLWTHGGVTSEWLKILDERLFDPNYRFNQIVKESDPKTISDKLELAWKFELPELFYNDMESGGDKDYAGPLWSRPYGLNIMPLIGINQVVGHTPQRGIRKEKVGEKTAHYFIDVLAHSKDALEIDF